MSTSLVEHNPTAQTNEDNDIDQEKEKLFQKLQREVFSLIKEEYQKGGYKDLGFKGYNELILMIIEKESKQLRKIIYGLMGDRKKEIQQDEQRQQAIIRQVFKYLDERVKNNWQDEQ